VRDEDSTTDPALHFVADKPSVKVAVYAVPLAISDDQLLWWSGLLSHGGSSPWYALQSSRGSRPELPFVLHDVLTSRSGRVIVDSMATITMRIPDDDLASIDAEAGGNRTQFMLDIVRAELVRRHRERLDEEVGRILAEQADENRAIAREFDATLADGIEWSAVRSMKYISIRS
jgi:hypothetical protein